jgi:PST family polysaccharide transporter
MALLTTFLAAPIVKTLFGSAYLASIPVLQVHIWSAIAVFLGVASGQWLLVERLQFISFIRTAIGLLANCLLNLWLIPRYGALGAALATSVLISCRSLPVFCSLVKLFRFTMLQGPPLHRLWS